MLLFTTLPVIFAFSSVAYTDMAPAFAQGAALFAFVRWLNRAHELAPERARRGPVLVGKGFG